jgi:hypothetical protein
LIDPATGGASDVLDPDDQKLMDEALKLLDQFSHPT